MLPESEELRDAGFLTPVDIAKALVGYWHFDGKPIITYDPQVPEDVKAMEEVVDRWVTANGFQMALTESGDSFKFDVVDEFDSYLVDVDDLSDGDPRLLDTNRHIVAPMDVGLIFNVTSSDVLHSFALPAIGMKVDAVTGRLNTHGVLLDRAGILRGQCSELCGTGHYGMPIVMEVVYLDSFFHYLEGVF